MKNKVKIFNVGVFLEALNQLKIVGIIACAVYLSAGILTPIGYMIDGPYYDEELGKWIPINFDAEYFFILFGLVYVFIPVMMMVIFFWMNKRHSCDFYHAIPIKRETMYISTIAAVFTWAIIIMTCACVVPLVIVGVNPLMQTEMDVFWKSMLYMTAAVIQMIGVFALGISLTGNGFTNVVASFMILVVPRAILTIIFSMIDSFMPFIQMNYGDTILNNQYNALFAPVTALFNGDGDVTVYGCALYSTILGLIYIAVACIMFKKRKSEVASQPSAYGIVQIICRMIPAFLFSLLGTFFVLETTISGYYDIEVYFIAVVWYVFALLIYFIYELITTRRWRKVGASAKQLPIFVGIVVTCGLAIGFGTYFAMNREIDSDKMEYVEVEPLYGMDYFAPDENVRIKDKDIFGLIEDAYEEQLEEYYDHSSSYYEDHDIIIGIKQDGALFYRRIYLTDYEMNKVRSAYIEALDSSDNEVNLPVYSQEYMDVYVDISNLNDKQIIDLYNVLCDEVREMSYKELFQLEEYDAVASVEIYNRSENRDDWRNIVIPISDLTPKTKAFLMASLLQNSDENNILEDLKDIDKEELDKVTDVDIAITVISRDKTGKYHMYEYGNSYGSDEIVDAMVEGIYEVITSTEGNSIIILDGYLSVSEDEGGYSEWIGGTFRVSDELIEKIIGLSKEAR